MISRLIRTTLALVSCALVILYSSLAGAADCDRGATVAADLFGAAEDHAVELSCKGKHVFVVQYDEDGGIIGRKSYPAKFAACQVGEAFSGFASAMHTIWKRLADDNWATIGPRKIEFDSVQSGTVVNPTRRTFVSAVPLASDSAQVTLTKRGGRSTTQIAVCSHGLGGDTRLERTVVIPGDWPDGYQWSPPELEGVLDRLISIQIQPTNVARQLGYALQVNKGPLVEAIEEEQSTADESSDKDPANDNINLPRGPTTGVQLPTSPVSLPGSVPDSGYPAPNSTGALPGISGSMPGVGGATQTQTTPTPAGVSTNTGQCLVTTTRRFPEIRLRCGLSVSDQIVRVDEGYLADCPLIAGDTVAVEVDERQREIRITGRVSGGSWCATGYSPGYYTGPCLSERTDALTTQTRTFFFQGRKMIDSIIPKTCDPARLEAGTYRVISETRTNTSGQGSKLEIREVGLRLEGDEMIGDISGLLSEAITQK